MGIDFVEQLCAGVFPVFLGQGEQAWNGAIHPFRSAPFYFTLVGGWDFLTWRSLSPIALEHLALLTATLSAALGVYTTGIWLAPRRGWLAAAVATGCSGASR